VGTKFYPVAAADLDGDDIDEIVFSLPSNYAPEAAHPGHRTGAVNAALRANPEGRIGIASITSTGFSTLYDGRFDIRWDCDRTPHRAQTIALRSEFNPATKLLTVTEELWEAKCTAGQGRPERKAWRRIRESRTDVQLGNRRAASTGRSGSRRASVAKPP
jgi:hypothetical protein